MPFSTSSCSLKSSGFPVFGLVAALLPFFGDILSAPVVVVQDIKPPSLSQKLVYQEME